VKISEKIFKRYLAWLKPKDQIKILLTSLFSLKVIKILLLAIIVVILAPVLFFFAVKPEIQSNINYGVNFSSKYATELGMDWKQTYIAILDDLGAKNIRLVAYWDDIEKTKGVYNYSDILWQLQEAEKRNLNVIMAIGRKVPRYPECFEPQWWREMESEEARNQELYSYIRETYNALNGFKSIKIWQVENEPFFPFGQCLPIKKAVVEKEIQIVRDMDPTKRPILTQDSGEGGFWFPSYKMADYLGISMYRKIWYNFWGVFLGEYIYFEYPLAHWSYKIKAALVGVPYQKIIVTELQAEPWGPGPNHQLTQEDKDRTMSRADFVGVISYAQKAGFKDLYFWGAEWWLFEKDVMSNPFYWNTAKALFQ
jgi:hypothetical protein